MLKNYLKVAWRSLLKHKLYSLIIIFGLAVGIAGCILITLFVRQEWSYDSFHEKADRICRLAVFENYSEQERFYNTVTPFPLGPALKQNFPEVVRYARVAEASDIVRRGEASFMERYHIVDPSFFEIFSFPLLRGDEKSALRDPGSVVLSERLARKYFGTEDPLGKSLTVKVGGKFVDLTVSAIARDVPENSSIRFDILVSMDWQREIWGSRMLASWFNVHPETYVELASGVAAKSIEPKLDLLSRLALGTRYKPGVYVIRMQPLKTIHLDKSFPSGLEPTSDPAYSYVLAGIALLVLLTACINFITLSIGRSASRAREVGVRKVVGAERSQLMRQFWGEAVLISAFSLVFGLILAELALPTFRALAGKSLTLDFSFSTIAVLAGLVAASGLAAGLYPAAVLSSFRPVDVLKGQVKVSRKDSFRRTLVIFQFALSIALIISTLIMSRQIRYLRAKDMGFKGEQVVVLRTNSRRAEGLRLLELFRAETAARPDIVGVAGAAFAFGDGWMEAGFTTDEGTYKEFFVNPVTHDFLKTMGIELLAGRDFSRGFGSDLNEAVIINETMAREFNLGPGVGRRLPGKRFPPHAIVGVVKDFHFESLHDPIRPLALVLSQDAIMKGIENVNFSSSSMPKILVRVRPDDIPAAMSGLRAAWKKIAPDMPFESSFLDQDVNRQYRIDERWARIVGDSTFFAILIACLGLFGLSSLTIARRTKEIGIRKVMGATVPGVVGILSRDFIFLILVSNVLAWPLAYFAMSRWIEDFAYRITIGPGPFVLAAALGAAIAQMTVSFQAVRAALADPVKAIRYE